MKKGDDFFRITFNRNVDEIRKFEQNMNDFTMQHPVSRAYLIAVVGNWLFENGSSILMSVLSDKIGNKNTADVPVSITAPEHSEIKSVQEPVMQTDSDMSDFELDKMLSSME